MKKINNGNFPTFLALFFGWFLYIFGRKMFSSTIPQLTYHEGYTKDQLGTIASSFSMAYGISKFLGAIISDHSDPGLLFSTGLFLTGLTTLIFPLRSTVYYFSVVLFLQGIFQGAGWPAIAKILKVKFSPNSVGLYWSLVSSASSIAAGIAPIFMAEVINIFEWYKVYYIIGVLSILSSLIIYFIIPSRSSLSTEDHDSSRSKPNVTKISFIDLLMNGDLWFTSWIYFFLYFMKSALCDWGQLYFIQQLGYKQANAAFCISMILLGGAFGNIAFGYISDYLMRKLPINAHLPRSPSLLISGILFPIFLHMFVFHAESEVSNNVFCFLLGFAIDGGIAVIGLVSMDTVPTHMTGMAHGVACAWAQVGTLMSGWPFSVLVVKYGWQTGFSVLEVTAVFVVMLAAYLSYRTFVKKDQLKSS